MTPRRQILFWTGALLAVLLCLWALKPVLLPFLVGMALAYLLDPIADRFEALGVPRSVATVLILLFFVLILFTTAILLFPLIRDQILALAKALPDLVNRTRILAEGLIDKAMAHFTNQQKNEITSSLGDIARNAISMAIGVVSSLWSGSTIVFNFFSILLITPLVAFYLLRDWDRIINKIDHWLPREHANTIRAQVGAIDRVLAGFVRGQTLVCLISAFLYVIGWTLVGLNFALVIGLAAGLLAFIPYVGGFAGVSIALTVGIGQFGLDPTVLGLIVGVYLVVQGLEGMVVQPRLVGRNVGLHDLWVIFALMAGGTLFGFVGVLIAVPVAASIGVLVRFSIDRYLLSPYYAGTVVECPPNLPGGEPNLPGGEIDGRGGESHG